MILEREDPSLYKAFADYFGDIDSIEQYMREEKLKSVAEFRSSCSSRR
jgi:hypothetical protein